MSTKFLAGWYVIYVRPRAEKKVYDLLIRNRYNSYLPLVERLKNWSDRKKIVQEPLFTSYVFVYLDHPTDAARILPLDGVSNFIKFNNSNARVRDEEIENIKILLRSGAQDVTLENRLPQKGEVLEIKQGLLQGLHCEIVRASNVEKILVRINSINICISATMPLTQLQRPRMAYK